ncbi:RdgB/HAM1 family non-canonical purine NTP pyrophosphatase [Dermacoccus nishinomiyaensis]|uniref:RdgB/HAM1 family non-canonical purine NTP pyrophosphatase n=1 Tax=Dermacoccus TaxID=57495 RepID=UPI00093B69ED|nr:MULTISPECIES: RdgB/HAM1 family non-canonical purine NTP pyrophosphatase [Dermacoccus]MCG7429321.1 RdgB/HAM1 family non-canonical purine NTP pyrophosphatase [Dermacoccus nishinomiyaensis]NHC32845.1 RdgB/HAM1 family non-canonical purine NTP pyrophosphatase [Dermacoccus nishinomiyaensis]QQY25722.1 RdgB/HAM1 family non-canonical purine NTP pyrophosphatase [Dermacoccus nishinomiyaensis]TJZ96898.1 RdgB/HAM1 family non-canonical purine NTP pyrophosphatase [Dermacoccus nishinomiyaensis]STD16566.1 d
MSDARPAEARTRVVLATRNAGKIADFQHLLDAAQLPIDVVSVGEFADLADTVETGVTFEENARLKADDVARATGLPALADDSGLAVDVLGGCPGVFSARWSGTHGADQANIDLLLAQTGDVPADELTARFMCCVALAVPDESTQVEFGHVEGRLTRDQRGMNGFGYDPIFELPDGRTMAELTADEKAAISHRGRAFRAILPQVAALV